MLSSSNKEALISLVRLGIGHTEKVLPERIDWDVIEALAVEQGLSAIVLDGIEKLPEKLRPPQITLLNWIGDVLQSYESRYVACKKTISEMASFYNAHGFKMMVLKGYSCSLDWPRPEHRPCGDIDIWQFGKQKEADAALAACSKFLDSGSKIDNSHHHHSVFQWGEFTVENHYDFIEVHHHNSSPEVEKILKELGMDDSCSVDVIGEKVYLPSSNLHALFLIRHTVEHFVSTDMTLRQLLDWAFFVKAHGPNVDWKWLEHTLEKFGMIPLYRIINSICVEDLGFEASRFPTFDTESKLKPRVLNEIFRPEFSENQPKRLLPRIMFKYRRWKANGWKYDLCYKGSRWLAFWSAAWNHILKPRTI